MRTWSMLMKIDKPKKLVFTMMSHQLINPSFHMTAVAHEPEPESDYLAILWMLVLFMVLATIVMFY